jgi:predicted aspartyl protease
MVPFVPRDQSTPRIDPAQAALSVNSLTRMAATVRVNRERALFVLDTGAERTTIATDLARTLQLAPGPDLIVHGVTAAETAPSAVLDRLEFGGLVFPRLVCPTIARGSLGADGLIGLDVLSAFELRLDLVRRAVTISASGQGRIVRLDPTRIRNAGMARTGRQGQLFLLNVRADGRRVEAFVDSGAQYSIGNLALMTALDLRATGDPVRVNGVTGQSVLGMPGRIPDLRIAGHRLGATPMLFADLHAFRTLGLSDRPAILLGADIVYRFQQVTLDFGRSRVGFGPLRRSFEPPPATG